MKTSSKIALSVLAAAGLATSTLVLAHEHEHGRHGDGPMEHCQKGKPGARLEEGDLSCRPFALHLRG